MVKMIRVNTTVMHLKTEFSFKAVLESVRFNTITTAVFLPHHVIIDLPKGRSKVTGTINGAPFSLSIQYRKEGARYFAIGSALRKAARIEAGDSVEVTFRILSLQKIDYHEVLETVLHHDAEVRKIGRASFSPVSPHPTLTGFLDAARNMDFRIRKCVEIVQRSKYVSPQPQQKKKNRNK
jgi:hypothetical protein